MNDPNRDRRHFWECTKRVRFDARVALREYEPVAAAVTEKAVGRPNATTIDRVRREPRHLQTRYEHMVSVQNLLRDVCERRPLCTIVYGDLGRYPTVLSYYLDCLYRSEETLAVRVGGNNADDHRRLPSFPIEEDYPDDGRNLDVLFWLEPVFDATIDRVPLRTKSLVVLTSHLNLRTAARLDSKVVAFCFSGSRMTRGGGAAAAAAAASPPTFLGFRAPEDAEAGFSNVETFVPDVWFGVRFPTRKPFVAETICADLSLCDSPSDAYLKLANASDDVRDVAESHPEFRNWYAVLKEDVWSALIEKLVRAKETLLAKRGKIPCNLNGIDLMVEKYVDPFLSPCI